MKEIRSLFVLLALVGTALACVSDLAAQVSPSNNETVSSTRFLFSAKSKNGFSTDLAPTDLQIKENGNPVAIQELKKLADPRMRYCILFDTSNSGKEDFRLSQRSALEVLQQAVHQDTDSGWLMLFDAKLLQSDETTDRMKIGKAIAAARPGGATAFYDAITHCAQRMADGPAEPLRKVMFIFSDGDDNYSQTTSKSAAQAVLRAGVRVYVVYTRAVIPRESLFYLQHLTKETGGKLFELNSEKDVAMAAAGMNQELTNLLAVTYGGNLTFANQPRHIELKCKRKGVEISAPQWIYLPN
jgi:VWFA-related protein